MTEHQSFDTDRMPEIEVPLDLQVRQHAVQAKKLQSEAMAESLATAWFGLSRFVQGSRRWLVRRLERSATRYALMECSDRTLADIGIPRAHIHLAARGIDVSDPMAVTPAGLWPRLVAAIRGAHLRRSEQLRTYRELMAYSDRELEEIGLRRSDIPTIIRAA